MRSSGINVEVFKPHSTRAAATSKASASFVPLDQILSELMLITVLLKVVSNL